MAPSFLGMILYVSPLVSPQLTFSSQFAVLRAGYLKKSLQKITIITQPTANTRTTTPPSSTIITNKDIP
ncbi:uncharacterized protein CELE_T02H6.6 [Caenorhabditis elegans]|uniref:Secreted protein n=1 Tax=Caenorhabditis elegans TaxID=6239 RepID=Q9N5E8_CAEEL|nr:Secreted protein [Caenorhabditis elegans]CCD73577.1 Secreted protein [Caenorhabditis elegans]|eukprot:NP_493791.2 Uncharacterized protein CELE_T02H6.6 [Caenorhabditis elegans]